MKGTNLKKRQIKITNTGENNWFKISNKISVVNEVDIDEPDM